MDSAQLLSRPIVSGVATYGNHGKLSDDRPDASRHYGETGVELWNGSHRLKACSEVVRWQAWRRHRMAPRPSHPALQGIYESRVPLDTGSGSAAHVSPSRSRGSPKPFLWRSGNEDSRASEPCSRNLVIRRVGIASVEIVVLVGDETNSGSRDVPSTRFRTPNCAVSPIEPPQTMYFIVLARAATGSAPLADWRCPEGQCPPASAPAVDSDRPSPGQSPCRRWQSRRRSGLSGPPAAI